MEKSMTQEVTQSVFRALSSLIGMPARRYWIDYDDEADVLYVNFTRPQKATDTELTNEGTLLRYRDQELVGITILDASERAKQGPGVAEQANAGDT